MKSSYHSIAAGIAFAAMSISLGYSQPVKEEDVKVDLKLIEEFYIAQKTEAAKPLEDLTAKYRAALEKVRADFQSAGNLDGVLEAQRGLTDVDDGVLPDGKADDATIARFETVYLKERAEVEKTTNGPIQKAQIERLQNLENLAVRLTKAGKIDDAIKVRAAIENAKRDFVADEKLVEPAKPVGEPVVEIISAVYGAGGRNLDVTKKVREFVMAKREFRSSPKYLEADPAPGWNKWLTIKFKKDGVARQRQAEEGNLVLSEYFYGPQDAEELKSWLSGTKWKAGVDIVFDPNQTFIIEGRIGSYRWSIPEHKTVVLEWSAEEKIECLFNPTWTGFEEQSGKKRLFRKTK